MVMSSWSCQTRSPCAMAAAQRWFRFRSPCAGGGGFRCLMLDPSPSTVASLLSSANTIAAAGSSSVHGAVASTITQVAFTAMAIASGACLSTKVDFLWPKPQDPPGSFILAGVDVTGCPIFHNSKVLKAVAFAKKAHHGQFRKTGDSYLTHCIHTGRILAMLAPSSGKRAVDTVVAGILHDIIDDTCENLNSIEEHFGEDVAKLVAGVSRLSYINQLLRRHRRLNMNQSALGHEEANDLRLMLLGMVDDPRVVLIKLADRLHNMRTIYALPQMKAQALAQETLSIWCSLGSRLGLWALKAELEDLCFAVLQPQMFQRMRSDLALMWAPINRIGYSRRISSKTSRLLTGEGGFKGGNVGGSNKDNTSMKDLLAAVIPFDVLLDRGKRTNFLSCVGESSTILTEPKVLQDARIALASLVFCEESLERELILSTSYVPGMEVTLSSRLKSLYSIYCKMRRKDVGINQIYDARALRVVVGDNGGSLHGPAVQCCYSFLDIVHRLWSPISGEFDDYIVNPKSSGYQVDSHHQADGIGKRLTYAIFVESFLSWRVLSRPDPAKYLQSLHTAVQGPDSAPLEVQIRTQKMHEYAEHGLAAHWLYKETGNNLPGINTMKEPEREPLSHFPRDADDYTAGQHDLFQKYGSLKAGHPVLRVQGSHLLAAVIVRVDKGGQELLVAVSFGLAASRAVAERRSSSQRTRWEAYARLHKKVSDEWWCEPGHGDWCTCLEKYTFCCDRMYHKQDQFERLLPTFIQVIDLTEEEESEYWEVVSAVFEGKPVDSVKSGRDSVSTASSSIMKTSINNKVRFLRTMLQWEEQLQSESSFKQVENNEVVIVCWPDGDIMKLSSGSTAGDAARRFGLEGRLVLVNGQLVVPNTELKDGDVVEVRL